MIGMEFGVVLGGYVYMDMRFGYEQKYRLENKTNL